MVGPGCNKLTKPRKQFGDLYEFRLLLEPEAAHMAARNMTPKALKGLEAAAGMRTGAPLDRTGRYAHFARADAGFHDAILRIAGNDVTRQALSAQHIHLRLFRLMFHARVTAEALDEHERLLTAFRDHDPDAAASAMRDHIERSRDRLSLAFE